MSPSLDGFKTPPRHQPVPASRSLPPRQRRRRSWVVGRTVTVLLVLGAIAVSVWAIPAMRREARASFTRLPSSYTELYFTSAPTIEHAQALVPVSLVDHAAHTRTYRLRVWLESSDGRTTASTTTTLTGRQNTPTSTVARLPLHKGALVAHVALLGSSQTLHYSLGVHSSPMPGGSS